MKEATSDETLILYYYDDGLSGPERARVRSAVRRDTAIRARYEQLRADLDHLDAAEAVFPAPDAVARWHDCIDRAARSGHQRTAPRGRASHFPSLRWGAALAASLLVGIGIGNYLSSHGEIYPSIEDKVVDSFDPDARSPSGTLARGLAVHLRESRRELVSLPVEARSERTMLITRMIQQNRLFERAATEKDSKDIARVLRAFEPILVQLASADISPAEAEALQAQLAFELNVVLTKYRRNASDETGPI